MKKRRDISKMACRGFAGWMLMVVMALSAVSARGQILTPLIQFTNVWKYDRSGLDLGAAWRTNDYDDSAWASGLGLLGYDDGGLAPYLAVVPSGFGVLFPPLSQVVTTYYFRTTFTLPGGVAPSAPGLQLISTNLMDDGGAIWLNGRLAGTLRMPAAFNVHTFATSGPTDGQLDTVILTNFLRAGVNTLAVEVHQNLVASGDMVWGMKLVAAIPSPIVITNQPTNQVVFVRNPVAFVVGVSGGPVAYRWQKDGLFLPNATNNTFTIAAPTFNNAGDYRVICSNVLGMVTSQVARLDVIEDVYGPKLVSAVIDESLGSNRILVRFDEAVTAALPTLAFNSPINPANYRLVATNDPGYAYSITIVRRSGSTTQLEIGDPMWSPTGSYWLTVNNVADLFTNSIAPNSTVPVQWQVRTNLFSDDHPWEFHNSAYFDPFVHGENWVAPDYSPGSWWGLSLAPFYGVVPPTDYCMTLSAPQTAIGWQPEPVLFRTTFSYPSQWSTNATLRLRTAFDDGLVLYLNGAEIYRNNVGGGAGSSIAISSRAITGVASVSCLTNISIVASNLLPGINHLAAAVVQSSAANDGDVYFTLEMDAVALAGPALPDEPAARIQVTLGGSNTVRLDWTGGGYFLESSTNLNSGSLSYPLGPWKPVPQISNPYHWSLTNSEVRYFRLKK